MNNDNLLKQLHEFADKCELEGLSIRHQSFMIGTLEFTPAEFREAINNKRFRWGLQNWEAFKAAPIGEW